MNAPSLDCYLQLIRARYPELATGRARLLSEAGQFNVVLCLDERWIFRFPKHPRAAAELARELEILPRLRGRLPLPIPDPVFASKDADGQLQFMGYAMIPGEPLLRHRYRVLSADERIVDGIARDLAGFLKALHAIDPADIDIESDAQDSRQFWRRAWIDVRERLFPHMRPDAREQVRKHFESGLNDADLWRIEPRLIHGDFGTGNILFNGGRVSGIIDFSSCGPGDPAQDLGALLSSYGERFIERFLEHYPALTSCLPRARFYLGNYALLQALYGLRDDDRAAFEDGIADYL